MNQHTLLSVDEHQQIQLLLPWYQNKSLQQQERLLVERHLGSCLSCAKELGFLAKMAVAVKQSPMMERDAQASFASLRDKLEVIRPVTQKPEPAVKSDNVTQALFGKTTPRRRELFHFNGRSVRGFAIAATVLLALIPVMLQYRHSPVTTDYYTLSNARQVTPVGTNLLVVFSKSLSEANIDELLGKVHGQRVNGPNSVGAYLVSLEGRDVAESVALLRNQPNVMLVEPVLEH